MKRSAVVLAVALSVGLGARSVRPQALPSGVDHYLCYEARALAGSPPFAPVSRQLRDQFPPPETFTLEKVIRLCNPADKAGEGIIHPADHQVGYRLHPIAGTPRFAKHTHVVRDQFGERTAELGRPDTLLVPSSKVLGAGGAPPYGPANVRHYTCYRARARGPMPPITRIVTDQFRVVPYDVKKLVRVCAPADKDGEDPTAPQDPGHLACYKVRGPKFARTTVSTDNQIRPERLDAVRPAELCVPALKDPLPSTTTTTVTTTSTTGTTATTTTTLPRPCGDPLSPPSPVCWGTCPAEAPICAATANGCECIAGNTPCGNATFPACDGACPPDQACVISLTLGCTCEFQGIPCAASYALTGSCGGVCTDPGDVCVGPFFTPDGTGCACVPAGSTCHLTCDPGTANCPPGETCGEFIPGLCLCQ